MDAVMEIGCATGRTLQWLHEKCGAKYTVGLELFEEAAKDAVGRCDEVHVADITSCDVLLHRFEKRMDLLLILDVLEHLADPAKALQSIKTVMNNEGIIIASIPNVRNVKVTVPLFFLGKFNYTDSGILDRTHVRFFTKSSVSSLFSQNGFEVLTVKANGPLQFSKVKSAAGWMIALFNTITLGLFDGLLANQWLVVAKVKY
jgi:2-polyprenyl-3-methyl-5-hydroxy-6-metoxy-1,4-benzoquinol methylase